MRKMDKRGGGRFSSAAAGCGIGAAVTIMLMLFGSFLISKEVMAVGLYEPIGTASLFFGAAAAGGFAMRKRKQEKIPTGLLTGAMAALILLGAACCLYGCRLELSNVVRSLVCAVTGGICGSVLLGGKRKE